MSVGGNNLSIYQWPIFWLIRSIFWLIWAISWSIRALFWPISSMFWKLARYGTIFSNSGFKPMHTNISYRFRPILIHIDRYKLVSIDILNHGGYHWFENMIKLGQLGREHKAQLTMHLYLINTKLENEYFS